MYTYIHILLINSLLMSIDFFFFMQFNDTYTSTKKKTSCINYIYIPVENRFARIGTRFSSEFGNDNPLGSFILFIRVRFQKSTLIRYCPVFEREPTSHNRIVIYKFNIVKICLDQFYLWSRAELSNMCLNS